MRASNRVGYIDRYPAGRCNSVIHAGVGTRARYRRVLAGRQAHKQAAFLSACEIIFCVRLSNLLDDRAELDRTNGQTIPFVRKKRKFVFGILIFSLNTYVLHARQ